MSLKRPSAALPDFIAERKQSCIERTKTFILILITLNLLKERIFMGIIAWIILGGLAGWVASLIMKNNASMGAFANVIVGIVGAFIGGFVMNLIGARADITGFNWESFFVALVGSVILLAIINLIRRGTVRNN
jgi:uncharacterized membrane protein YeaQ/YmgE (transglycosylase-associated protein family)